MNLGKLGVWCATDSLSAKQIADLATRVEALGYGALWYPESRIHESFALGSFLLGQTRRLVAATGIANIYARDPTTAANGRYTLNKLSGGRFLLGLGVSHVPNVEGVRGHAYGKPVPTMRAYLDAMEQSAAGLPALPEPPVTVLAALGPLMTDLAAQRTQGLHPYCVDPAQTEWARKRVGPGPWICVEQMIVMEKDPARARAIARAHLARYQALPNYRNNWLRNGYSEAEITGAGSDRFVDGIIAWGDAAAIRKRIQAHWDAGANHVCIQALTAMDRPPPDYAALRALAPGKAKPKAKPARRAKAKRATPRKSSSRSSRRRR